MLNQNHLIQVAEARQSIALRRGELHLHLYHLTSHVQTMLYAQICSVTVGDLASYDLGFRQEFMRLGTQDPGVDGFAHNVCKIWLQALMGLCGLV